MRTGLILEDLINRCLKCVNKWSKFAVANINAMDVMQHVLLYVLIEGQWIVVAFDER